MTSQSCEIGGRRMDSETTSASKEIEKIVGMVREGARVMVIGEIASTLARRLSDRRCQVHAVMPDLEAAQRARALYAQVTVAEDSRLEISWDPGADRFDTVIVADTWKSVGDPVTLLKIAHGVLLPAGCLIVLVGHAEPVGTEPGHLDVRHSSKRGEVQAGSPPRSFNFGTLEADLDRCGFTIAEFARHDLHDEDAEIPRKSSHPSARFREPLTSGRGTQAAPFIVVAYPRVHVQDPGRHVTWETVPENGEESLRNEVAALQRIVGEQQHRLKSLAFRLAVAGGQGRIVPAGDPSQADRTTGV